MVVSRLALPRRTVLRGIGASLALPLLDAMVPALTATSRTAAKVSPRLGVFYLPNGVILTDFVPPTAGTDFEIRPNLKPVERFRQHMTIVSGLANAQSDPLDAGSGPHSRVSGAWLSGVRARRTEGHDLQAGITVDQIAAQTIGKESPLKSLELALEPNFTVGVCEGGYSCTYINTFTWRTPTMPLPMETNPSVVFERLFGDGGTTERRLAEMTLERSILDSVSEDLARLKRSVGPSDRSIVDEYLSSVRDVERRIQQTQYRAGDDTVAPDRPLGIPVQFEDHARLMMDLMWLAYRGDMTRVSTFQIARELSMRSYPELGVAEGHHDISHHGDRAEAIAKKSRIDTFHVQLFSHFLERMASTQDGDGSLLDHSIILLGGGMGNGNLHSPHNLPIVLFGRGSGTLTPGRHVKVAFDTPFMNLGVTLLDKLGVHVDQVGDSTGRLSEI
jgi:hypothetical protein